LDPPQPLFQEFRQLILRKCVAAKRKQITGIFEREPFGEFERFISHQLLNVAKRVAKDELQDEKWIHRVAMVSSRGYQEARVFLLEFLDTDVFHVSVENCVSFLHPLIESWDVDLQNFGMEVALNRRLSRDHRKKLAFREVQFEVAHQMEPGLTEFLRDVKLSAGITDDETAFLKSLHTNGKRPSSLYYYRELQNLRDPLNFLPLSIGKRLETSIPAVKMVVRKKSRVQRSPE
jgi:hypothetical protein